MSAHYVPPERASKTSNETIPEKVVRAAKHGAMVVDEILTRDTRLEPHALEGYIIIDGNGRGGPGVNLTEEQWDEFLGD